MVEESSKESWRRRRNLALSKADDVSSDLGREFSYRNFLRMGWKVPVLEIPGWLDDTTVWRRLVGAGALPNIPRDSRLST